MLEVKISFTGPPGSGKTTLMQIAMQAFRDQGHCITVVHPEKHLENSMNVALGSWATVGKSLQKKQVYADKRKAQTASRYVAGRRYAKQEAAYLAGMATEPEVPEGCLGNEDFQAGYDDYLSEPDKPRNKA